MRRELERGIIPMARHGGMALAPWPVLGGGKFLESVKTFNMGFPNDFIGPDPHGTGQFTGLAAANAPIEVERLPKPAGLA